jgi:hypothetical protein
VSAIHNVPAPANTRRRGYRGGGSPLRLVPKVDEELLSGGNRLVRQAGGSPAQSPSVVPGSIPSTCSSPTRSPSTSTDPYTSLKSVLRPAVHEAAQRGLEFREQPLLHAPLVGMGVEPVERRPSLPYAQIDPCDQSSQAVDPKARQPSPTMHYKTRRTKTSKP